MHDYEDQAEESQSDKLEAIFETAMAEFNTIQSTQADEREQCYEDRRFYSIAGAQWEGSLGEQFANKPKFEVNKIHLAVIRIINQYRNNRSTVKFVSKDGSDAGELASTCNDLYRSDEQDSCAEEAYDNAFEEAVGGGFGAFRMSHEYEDEDDDENEHQRIRFLPIFDADKTVFFDAGARRQDKSDASFCFVLTAMTKAAFEEEYGEDAAAWNKEVIDDYSYDWVSDDSVMVAEYFKVERQPYEVVVYTDAQGEEVRYSTDDFEQNPGLELELLATGHEEVRRKKVKRRRVHKYIMSGDRILEDCGTIAGPNIPIIPVYGKRWIIDNIERCMGHVRLAKDVQRLKNMQLSKLGEISALSSVEKPIFTGEQVAGHQVMWQNDNIEDYAYLTINPVTDASGAQVTAGPVGYTKPAQIPPALAALLQTTEADMGDLLGNQEAGEEMMSNISGVAVELIQQRLDMQAYIYISNFAKALKRAGEVWLGMAKEVLVEPGRKMKAVGTQGQITQVELMRPVTDDSGDVVEENDLTRASFDVAVDVGPSSSSKKSAELKTILNMLQINQDPETAQVLSAMAMLRMEGEGAEDIKEFFRDKLIKMGAAKPTKEESERLAQEAEQAQSLPPTPQNQYFLAEAEKAQAAAAKARVETIYTQKKAENEEADTGLTEAKTLETLASIEQRNREATIDAIDSFSGIIKPKSN